MVRHKRVWHDFEAVLVHAFDFQIPPSRDSDGPNAKRGAKMKVPVFGCDAKK